MPYKYISIYILYVHSSEKVACTKHMDISSSLFIFLCLSQKVPSNPRYLWTQLSSVDSTSVDTDYEQYEPSNDPSVTLTTFRSELCSFIFISICIYFCVFLSLCLLRCSLAVLLHFAVEAALPCMCVQSVHISAVCSECLQDGLWLKLILSDSQRYRTDVNPLRPSGLDSLFEEGESLLVCKAVTKTLH